MALNYNNMNAILRNVAFQNTPHPKILFFYYFNKKILKYIFTEMLVISH